MKVITSSLFALLLACAAGCYSLTLHVVDANTGAAIEGMKVQRLEMHTSPWRFIMMFGPQAKPVETKQTDANGRVTFQWLWDTHGFEVVQDETHHAFLKNNYSGNWTIYTETFKWPVVVNRTEQGSELPLKWPVIPEVNDKFYDEWKRNAKVPLSR